MVAKLPVLKGKCDTVTMMAYGFDPYLSSWSPYHGSISVSYTHLLFTCNTYVYLWKKHPLAGKKVITLDDLQEYPCLTFEQGVNNSFYYAEEMMSTYEYKRVIKADEMCIRDRCDYEHTRHSR